MSKAESRKPRRYHRNADGSPAYRLHLGSGQAIVTINGREHYLGLWRSPKSHERYAAMIRQWRLAGEATLDGSASLVDVLLAYRVHALDYYKQPTGGVSAEVEHIGNAVRVLRELYASTPAAEFSPLKLRVVRDAMVAKGWSRMYVNSQVKRLRRIFRWAASVELLPVAIHQALATVDPLKRGRTTAPDHPEVRPVDWSMVQAILPHVSRQVGAMIELQWLTGMRGGEVTAMRAADIDMNANVWTYRPTSHKTSWRGHQREIALGPQAQAIIREFLTTDTQRFLFSPADAEAERRRKLHARRKTPLSCGNKPGTNRKRRPAKRPGDRYDSSAYHHAIVMACGRALPLPEHLQPRVITSANGDAKPRRETRAVWRMRLTDEEKAEIRAWRREHRFHPHQLRHSFATRVRREHGIEAAKILLGHKGLDMTLRYAEDDRGTAHSVAAKIG